MGLLDTWQEWKKSKQGNSFGENFSGMKAIKYEAYDDIAEQITEPFIPTSRLKDYISSITGQKRTGVPLQESVSLDDGRYVRSVKEAFDGFGIDE